jgi:nucleoside-diphosphate-sugar epimerase
MIPKQSLEVYAVKDDLILVAGAGGFIGGHLVADLLRRSHTHVRAVGIKPLQEWFQVFAQAENVSADLKDPEACRHACREAVEVYNLAADMGGMGFIEHNKALCMLSVLINTHLLLAAREMGVQRYFYASSACVYNADKQKSAAVLPLKEEDAYPAMPEDGYGWEKLFSERMCRHFTEDFGLLTRCARFHNVYGPHGSWEGGREKAPAAVCRKVIHAKLSGQHEIDIWGDGNQTRSFMYIDDCLFGIERIMHGRIEEPINLGSSELVTINGLVDIVEDIAGVKLRRTYDLTAPKGVHGRNSDNTRIRQYLGWEPSTRLRDGLERTYAWIYDQYQAKYGAARNGARAGSPLCVFDGTPARRASEGEKNPSLARRAGVVALGSMRPCSTRRGWKRGHEAGVSCRWRGRARRTCSAWASA